MPTLDQLRGDVRAKAIAFLFCVGVLSDIFGVVDRLDSVLPIVAAFVPLAALAGTLTFGALIIVRVVEWLVDRRKGGPAKRALRSKLPAIKHCKELLLSLDRRPLYETDSEYQGRVVNVYTEIEILAYQLKELGISTPPIRDLHHEKKRKWVSTLARLEGYARSGYLEAAVQYGNFWRPDSETVADT